MSPRLIMKLSVVEIRKDRGDVMVVTLRHPRRPSLPVFTAGSHVDVHLPDGQSRQYSLCGDPADSTVYRLAIKLEQDGRGVSKWLHENLAEGALLSVSAPRNHFELAPEAKRYLLVAGGIGVTPILAMTRSLASGAKPFEMHYFTRSRTLTPLMDDIAAIGLRAHVQYHFDDDPDTRVDLAELMRAIVPGTHIYCCGPGAFMDAIRAAATHWPEGTVHFEAFQAPADDGFVPEPFAITLRSGVTLEVPADKSTLEVLRLAGIDAPSSCETGICGACECGYLAGEPIHRDAVLSPQKRLNRFMPCVSRGKGILLLDL